MDKLHAIAPDGTVLTRRSYRDYKFVVIAKGKETGKWGWVQWCSRRDLAEKAERSYRNRYYGWSETQIVPVERDGK